MLTFLSKLGSRSRWVTLIGLGVVLGLGGAWVVQAAGGLLTRIETGPGATRREITSTEAQAPTISFIDSSNATCSRPVPQTGICYVQWTGLYVSASPSQYIISMTVAVQDQIRASHAGFFQSSMYIPGDMYGPGFQVTCGLPNPAAPNEGATYTYAIRARETGGLTAANYGSVTCPADAVQIHLPLMQR